MRTLTAAIDVGGTKIAGALVGEEGVLHRSERPTPGPAGAADPQSRAFRAVASDLAERAGELGRRVDAVGVGCCEYVADGKLLSSEVLAWSRQPRDWLPEIFPGADVRVESDVRCGLLAEHTLGAARGLDSALFISWGTGLSSALLVAGMVWPGARGRAIAFGELPAPDGLTVEQFASGAGMLARWRTASRGDQQPSDGDQQQPGRGTRELMVAAAAGDPTAAAIARSAGQALAEALRSAVNLLDPSSIVLGGGLGSADTVARRAAARAWLQTGSPVPLAISRIGPDGPLLGAALLAGWSGRAATTRRGTGQR